MRTITATICVAGFILSGCSRLNSSTPAPEIIAAATGQPAWEEFAPLLDKPIDSPEVQAFATRYHMQKYTKFDSGGFDQGDNSFSLIYSNDRIVRVVIKVTQFNPGWQAYYRTLPGGVLRTDSPDEVVAKLGTPTHRPEPTYLVYADSGLSFSFDRDGKRLQEITYDSPQQRR